MRLFFAGLFTGRPALFLSKAAAVIIMFVFLSGCGDTFRPVSNPIAGPGGDPSGTVEHAIIVNANGTNSGTTIHFDVSGDTAVAVENVGVNPVHAAIIGGNVVVANRVDGTLSVYPTTAGPSASVQTATLPSVVPKVPDAQPVFVTSTDNTNIYVAQNGRNSVGVVPLSSVPLAETTEITDSTSFSSLSSPVAIAQLPNGGKIYVANAGSNLVTVIDPTTTTVKSAINIGTKAAAIVASSDGNCVYVASQASGSVTVINAVTDAAAATITTGPGPNFLRFDPKLQRVYVANNGGNTISVINHAADCSANSATSVVVGANPHSIAALSDGTRAYVANTDGSVTVLNASSNTLRKTIPASAVGPAVAPASPLFIDSSADGTKVVVANSGGAIAIIRTSDDTVVLQLLTSKAPFPGGSTTPQFVLMNP